MLEGGSKTRDGREPKREEKERERVRGSACVVIDERERERRVLRRLERSRLQHSGISLGRLDIDERVAPGQGRESEETPFYRSSSLLLSPPRWCESSASVFSASV